MAVIAGAGNPTGGFNPSGTSQNLVIIGNHCYAYSGSNLIGSEASTANITFLLFQTGTTYADVKITWANNERASNTYYKQVKLNEETIYIATEDESPNKLGVEGTQFIIPPYSRFEVLYGSSASGTLAATVSLTGKIYA